MENFILNPISTGELERRWAAARQQMRQRGIDALVIQGTNDWLGGCVKWFTDIPAYNGYPKSLIFHRDEPMTIVEIGPRGARKSYGGQDCIDRGVGDIIGSDAFASICYNDGYHAELIVDELKHRGYKTVGMVAPGAMLHRFVADIMGSLEGAVTFVDATSFIDQLKAIKSSEEIELCRRAAEMQDAVFERILPKLQPGMRHFEITALAWYEGRLLGSEQGLILSTSAPIGHRTEFLDRYWQGRTIQEGEHFSLLLENSGPGCMYTEMARTVVFGKASSQLTDGFEAMKEAQRATLALMKPGAACQDVAAAHDAYMRSHGFPVERRLYSHGQGYDLVERPLIRADETMLIEKNMNFAVHPGYEANGIFSVICDNYLIGDNGPGACQHKTPQTIFEI